MTWFLTLAVLILPLLLIWQTAIGLLVRPWGIRFPLFPLPLKKLSAAIRGLSKWEYIIVEGVLGWGVGTRLLLSATDFVSSRVNPKSGLHHASGSFVVGLVFFMLGGVGWGWIMWNTRDHSPDYQGLSISPKPPD